MERKKKKSEFYGKNYKFLYKGKLNLKDSRESIKEKEKDKEKEKEQ